VIAEVIELCIGVGLERFAEIEARLISSITHGPKRIALYKDAGKLTAGVAHYRGIRRIRINFDRFRPHISSPSSDLYIAFGT
jgi:hypothetical protein